MTRNLLPARLAKLVKVRKLQILLFIAMFVVVGIATLTLSHADTIIVNTEAESGLVSTPASKVSDVTASGGQTIKFAAATISSAPRKLAIARYGYAITVSGITQEVGYYSNGSLDVPDANVERVVFVIHGTDRNAEDYGDWEQAAATKAGAKPESTTLVIAPHFIADSDIKSSDTRLMYWTEQGWKDGDNSRTSPYSRPWRMSSYEVLDRMIQQAKANFPKLKSVGIIGHSAGAQYINRYAAGTKLLKQLGGIDFRFALANPSSYLYFDERRPDNGAFTLPTASEKSSCSDFNTYKYGLKGMNDYMALTGAANLANQYKNHKVYYLLGDKDITDAHSMDTTCPATMQGPFRFQRGNNYFDYLAAYFGAVPAGHTKLIVRGVDHDGEAMLNSAEGQQAMYGP